MRRAGRVVAEALSATSAAAKPGVSLLELDEIAREVLAKHGANSSFLGYHPHFASTPYPAVICASVNEVVVHGIPDGYRLREGDLLSIDFGAELDGYHADAAITVGVGEITAEDRRLLETTERALQAGISAARPGNKLGDIGAAVSEVARRAGYGMPRDYGGHGIGRRMHEDPSVPNEGKAGRGLRLHPGLVIAIEPMLIAGGKDDCRLASDGWAVVTADGSRAAHFEHTVAITERGPRILTLP